MALFPSEPTPAQITSLQATAALGTDTDLPAEDRRTRSETLKVRGTTISPGGFVGWGTVYACYLGLGRGKGRFAVGWIDATGNERVATVTALELEVASKLDPGATPAQANAAYAVGRSLFLTAGSFTWSSVVTIPEGGYLVGAGAGSTTIVRGVNSVVTCLNSCTVHGIQYDLNAAGNFPTAVGAVGRRGLFVSGCDFINNGLTNTEWTIHGVLAVSGCQDVRVRNCTGTGTQLKLAGSSMPKSTVRSIKAYDLVWDTPRQYAVSCVAVGVFDVRDVYFGRIVLTNPTAAGGLYIGDDSDINTYHPDSFMDNVLFEDCSISGNWGSPCRLFNLLAPSAGGTVTLLRCQGTGNIRGNNVIGVRASSRSGVGAFTKLVLDYVDIETVSNEPFIILDVERLELTRCTADDCGRAPSLTADRIVKWGATDDGVPF